MPAKFGTMLRLPRGSRRKNSGEERSKTGLEGCETLLELPLLLCLLARLEKSGTGRGGCLGPGSVAPAIGNDVLKRGSVP